MIYHRVPALMAAAALLVGAFASSQGALYAQSIGLNFVSDRDTTAALNTDEVAGAPGAAQANWNNTELPSGDTTNITSPTAGTLVDSTGAATGVTVQWGTNGTWNTANGTATPDAKLMNGYADFINADGGASVTFSNIEFDLYDVYAYVGSDGNGRTGQITDGTTTFSYSTFSNDPDASGGFDAADFALTTDTADGFPNANYAVFRGLSGDSFTLDIIRGDNNSGFHGVQIVRVPEPGSLVLVAAALFGIGLLARSCRSV